MIILLHSSVPRNTVAYIRWWYIPRLLHLLTEEYNIYSSVIQLRSSVITEEHILVSCCVWENNNVKPLH
jgi:hypothetical protein